MTRLRQRLLGISESQTSFVPRGFHWRDENARQHLEKSGAAFVHGYNSALSDDRPEPLASRLHEVELEKVGFAFEGASMALALLDLLTPFNHGRLERFLHGPGSAHVYMVHVGAGWAAARLRRSPYGLMNKMHPLFRWLAVDGYGFHEGYFHSRQTIQQQKIPRRITGYAGRAFDQGLGRSLWFVYGADVEAIVQTVQSFEARRRPDLYSGVGLAAAYAGGIDDQSLRRLKSLGSEYESAIAQGAAFAAKARMRAGHLASHTEIACQILCEIPAEIAAAITDEALQNLPADGAEPSYEIWRCRIQAAFSRRPVSPSNPHPALPGDKGDFRK
ncbi:MAG TPA: DUF1702 family protein [Candidatus Deferrimicrobium sp.]|nr:DUF1702 family protein [Candidatus Deferrimicrobium sp.]